MKAATNFLETIVQHKRLRLEKAKRHAPFSAVRAAAYETRARMMTSRLSKAIAQNAGISVVAEIKRASPSKGDLQLTMTVAEVARAYSRGGATAISVLTEEDHFRGSLEDLRAVRHAVSLPLLRKDFIFDEYQVFESAAAGADALLLIVAFLADEQLAALRELAEKELGMDALVEVHTAEEMERAVGCGATLIGVNNRNLHSFETSIDVSIRLIKYAPRGALLISESGLKTGAEIKQLRMHGYDTFLIGETLIRSECPEQSLRQMIKEATA